MDQKNQPKRRFLRKQREKEDFWDEHEDFWSESSFDKAALLSLAWMDTILMKKAWIKERMEGGMIHRKSC